MPTRRTLLAGLACGGLGLAGCSGAGGGTDGSAPALPFPSVDLTRASAHQRRLVAILRHEFAAQPRGTRYSAGIEENWCADFVSFVERGAGRPFTNPNSGGWRIPGTMTLLDFFRERRVWHPMGSGYRPVLGDVAIYDGSGPFGQHTNVVLSVRNGLVTTIGGNEQGGIRVRRHPLDASLQALGHAHW